MSIYEAIGMAWVIFTAAIATVEILYLAFVGLKTVIKRQEEARDSDRRPRLSHSVSVHRDLLGHDPDRSPHQFFDDCDVHSSNGRVPKINHR